MTTIDFDKAILDAAEKLRDAFEHNALERCSAEVRAVHEAVNAKRAATKALANAEGHEEFFVVLRHDDMRLHRHSDETRALNEAQRLARTVPGKAFFVLGATKSAEVPEPPVLVRRTIPDPIPF